MEAPLTTTLDAVAAVASIITALVAVMAYGRYQLDRWQKRLRLERFLAKPVHWGGMQPRTEPRPLLELSAELGMTEAELLDAAFRSRVIKRTATPALLNAPSRILLEFSPNGMGCS
jgi:hypothetical protein